MIVSQGRGICLTAFFSKNTFLEIPALYQLGTVLKSQLHIYIRIMNSHGFGGMFYVYLKAQI